jgi:N-acetylglucosaminyldiphosphoundecaprenol N-acetyl-beta-D-mannosaminyltransferase
MTPDENAKVLSAIKTSGADIVWLGISSPKQDIWMRDNVDQLSQTLIGVGAAFDFLSGEVRRAPVWMQKSGLECLFRLLLEPRRLWRRYFILAPQFVWHSARSLVS